MVNSKAGKLILLGAQDDDWVQRLCAGADVCPAPVRAVESGPAQPNAAPNTGPNSAHSISADLLPWQRPITASDRLLVWLAAEESDALAAHERAANPVVAHALVSGADVWLISRAHSSRAAELIDVLGITLCAHGVEQGRQDGVRCQSVAGETLEPGRTGWLVWAATESGPARSAGYIDPHGWVHVLGAAAHTLVVEDGLLTPFEGAARLATHSGVTQAAMVLLSASQCAAAGLEAGFFAVAEVTRQATPVLEVELLDYVRRGVSAAKCPQGIVCVSELPTRQTGAADMQALEAMVAAQFEALSVD